MTYSLTACTERNWKRIPYPTVYPIPFVSEIHFLLGEPYVPRPLIYFGSVQYAKPASM